MECSTTCSSNENICDSNNKNDFDESKEAEGVWSPDIENSFNEALQLYPPCGRRKIVLSEEGKMYGRNELIARYIKMQTGKSRSRKQVSSHIQVLARRKSKEIQNQIQEKHTREQARQQLANMSSAQIVSDFKIKENLSLCNDNRNKSPKFVDNNINSFSNTQGISRFSSIHHPTPLVANSKLLDTSSFLLRPNQIPPIMACTNTHNMYLKNDSPNDLISHNHTPIPAMWNVPHMSRASSLSDQSSLLGPHLYVGRSIATPKMRLLELSVFVEAKEYPVKIEKGFGMKNYCKHVFAHLNSTESSLGHPFLEHIEISQIWDKYPETDGLKEYFERGPQDAFFMVKFWIDMNFDVLPQWNQLSTIIFEGVENVKSKLSTKICSFGRQVLERIEEQSPILENGISIYRFENVPMCDYMRKFIIKLSSLKEHSLMNSVLENFTILQTVTNAFTGEILLCIAFAMEVSISDQGSQYHIYKLIRNSNLPTLSNFSN
uniref:SD2 n=1 Tax=Schmidtea mediterranea TaxID=79327 RepID=W8E1N4_SCHMD|nr:SD2 [Schmidtea mediterranea]